MMIATSEFNTRTEKKIPDIILKNAIRADVIKSANII